MENKKLIWDIWPVISIAISSMSVQKPWIRLLLQIGHLLHRTWGQDAILLFPFNILILKKILKIIEKLKPKTISGPDGQSSKLLKAVGNILAPTLSVIINQSLYTGIFPDKVRVAKVLPLLKKGDNWLMENYRPISLLSTLSKVFERVVFE